MYVVIFYNTFIFYTCTYVIQITMVVLRGIYDIIQHGKCPPYTHTHDQIMPLYIRIIQHE